MEKVFTTARPTVLSQIISSKIKIAVIFFVMVCSVSFGQNRWVTGYYPTWWYGSLSPSAFNMNSLTHLIIFAAQDANSASPYFNASNMDDGTNMESLISIAHSKNVKVVASITGGYGQTNMPVVAADAAKCSTFVATACAWAKARNFDGVELDWEFPRSTDVVGWNRLIRLLRIELNKWSPRGLLLTSANYTAPASPYVKDSMAVFDQINLMSYTMWMGPTQESPYKSGFDTPVNLPTQFSGYSGTSCATSGVLGWVSAGYPASQIGLGIPFESTIFTGATTMGQSYTSWGFGSVATTGLSSGYPSVPTSGRQYDATAQAAYCVNGGKVYSYQDTNSIKAIVAFAKTNKLGGVMVWDFPAGQDKAASPNDLLLRTVARETFSNVITPAPATSVITASPNLIVANGTSTSTIMVQLKDSTGCNITTGGCTVSLTTTMGTLSTVKDNGNGTYTATYTSCTIEGTAIIQGKVNSQSIKDTATVYLESTLPVQLVSFNGEVVGNKVSLKWKTATEVNSNSFQVERRTTGNWETIGKVAAHGVSNAPKEYTYTDNLQNLSGGSFRYRLKTIDNDGSFTYSSEIEMNLHSSGYALKENYPNPFNPQTKIGYSLPENAYVRLVVYDILGREVMQLVNENQVPGEYETSFNGLNLASGVYFYRLTAEGQSNFTQIKKMVLMK